MRDHDTSSVRQLIFALHSVEDELRPARGSGDVNRLIVLIRHKQAVLRELRRRRLQRMA
ncbi:hypothetical protein EV652_112137 [Kribbella steppae]|uniref:Uncharacterized protein n=1 Tax=Kribbella steppae TaxID=2512223 RepID=A0A4R2H457_9ACTN|nr:hypothetical protein [Kribbella steppae]TCO20391.1 hypothetical protein EV652_112137 [Kribbella steppae]